MKITCIYFIWITCFLFFIPGLLHSQNGNGADWNQFRGMERSGISPERGLLNSWPESGLELVWKKEMGESFSEIVVSGTVCYTHTSEQTDSVSGVEYAIALDMDSGEEIWKTRIDSLFIDVDDWGDGPRSTPVVDDDKLYCFSSFGKLSALSKEDGTILWSVDFVKELGSTVPRWAFSNSPLLVDNVLIMEAGGAENKAFAAFDKNTGELIWTKGQGGSSYCSPVLAEIEGQKQIIFAHFGKLYSFLPNGDTLWTFNMSNRGPTAIPIFIAPDKIFLSEVSRVGSSLVQIVNQQPKELWNSTSMQNHWSSSIYYDGYLYGFNVAALQCISVENGEKKWSKRGYGKGSLVWADEKLFILTDKGKLVLAKASPEEYEEISSFQALKQGRSWTAPAVAHGKIFLRNLREVACYKLKENL